MNISLEDEIYKQAQSICDKLNECFLDFNVFGNYNKVISFELYIYRIDGKNKGNKLYFIKYQLYKSGGRLVLKHLKEDTLFTEFFYYDYVIKRIEYMSRQKGYVKEFKKILKD